MRVIELNSESIEAFIRRQPVTAVVYFTPNDRRIDAILREFSAVAQTFEELVAFGSLNVAASENTEILTKCYVVMTPTVIYYRFGEECGDDLGEDKIMKWLDHDSIVHRCGHTDSWLRLVR
ncbi:MAG: hypothetical protein WD847_18700 [Pirellulales bacterium]